MDIDYKICLTSGFLGFDLEKGESEEEFKEMSEMTLKNIQSQLIYWNMVISNELIERGENG